jgi:hypothetical protein
MRSLEDLSRRETEIKLQENVLLLLALKPWLRDRLIVAMERSPAHYLAVYRHLDGQYRRDQIPPYHPDSAVLSSTVEIITTFLSCQAHDRPLRVVFKLIRLTPKKCCSLPTHMS